MANPEGCNQYKSCGGMGGGSARTRPHNVAQPSRAAERTMMARRARSGIDARATRGDRVAALRKAAARPQADTGSSRNMAAYKRGVSYGQKFDVNRPSGY